MQLLKAPQMAGRPFGTMTYPTPTGNEGADKCLVSQGVGTLSRSGPVKPQGKPGGAVACFQGGQLLAVYVPRDRTYV